MFELVEAKRFSGRLEFVFTPKHDSWLNMVEIELHVLNAQCLNRHTPTIDKMKKEVNAWKKHRSNKEFKIDCQLIHKNAQIKLKRLYPSFDN